MRTTTNINQMTFATARRMTGKAFALAPVVHTESWQGQSIKDRPEGLTRELINYELHVPLNGISDLDHWRMDVQPNLPWADDHFAERVCGYPINPGVEWANWPWGGNAEKFLNNFGLFNHNYMERYWPMHAGQSLRPSRTVDEFKEGHESYLLNDVDGSPHFGVCGEYGDLHNLVNLLVREPLTRQAWFPVFFPEDTGDANPGRKPCTLGYQFMVREDQLHVYYPLRSCDFAKHWADDIYLTLRLALWVIEQCAEESDYWKSVKLGSYHMHCTSLHLFINDYNQLMEAMK